MAKSTGIYQDSQISVFLLILIFIIITVDIYYLVDQEEGDYECASVLSIHSQDVKCVKWHPHREVHVQSLLT